MSQAQEIQSPFVKQKDPAEECVAFFNKERQARLSPEMIARNLNRLKKMAISSTNNVKLGLIFIKENFGGIWLMTLKVILASIPLFITLIITCAMMFGSDFLVLSDLPAVGITPPVGETTQMMGSPPVMPMDAGISSLSMGGIIIAGLINLAALILSLLVFTAMMVAMIRSVVFQEKLDTTIFSKICDKTVLKVFMTELIITLLFTGVIVIIIGAATLLTSSSGSGAMLQGLLFSLPVMIPAIIYLALRLSLIPIGVAVGDIQCASEAFPKTKGQLFNVFKIILLAFLISIVLQLMTQIPNLIMGIEGAAMSIVGFILLLAALIITVPLHNIGLVSLSHLYKKIR